MIVVGPPNGAVKEITAVAAAKVEDDRRRAAKEGRVIERALGQPLQGRLGPLRRFTDLTGDGDAELAFDVATCFHILGMFSREPRASARAGARPRLAAKQD